MLVKRKMNCCIWIDRIAAIIMFTIFDRCATKNVDFDVISKNNALFDRSWLLNSENSSIFYEFSEIVNSTRMFVKMSLDTEVDDANVKENEMNSWVNWSRIRKIWSVKSTDVINEENFCEKINLRLTNSEFVVSFKNSRECRNANLNNKFIVFSNWIIDFRNSSRSMVYFCDQMNSFADFSRVFTAFKVRKNVVWLMMFEIKNFVFVKTRSKNLCSVRKKFLS